MPDKLEQAVKPVTTMTLAARRHSLLCMNTSDFAKAGTLTDSGSLQLLQISRCNKVLHT
jgi:hypothetical protein